MGATSSSPSPQQESLNLIVCGNTGVGKTSVVQTLAFGSPTLVFPTAGFDVQTAELSGEECNLIEVTWTALSRFRGLGSKIMRACTGIVHVVDASDPKAHAASFAFLREMLSSIDLPRNAPLLVLAHKREIAGSTDARTLLQSVADLRGLRTVHALETSTADLSSIVAAGKWITEASLTRDARHERLSTALLGSGLDMRTGVAVCVDSKALRFEEDAALLKLLRGPYAALRADKRLAKGRWGHVGLVRVLRGLLVEGRQGVQVEAWRMANMAASAFGHPRVSRTEVAFWCAMVELCLRDSSDEEPGEESRTARESFVDFAMKYPLILNPQLVQNYYSRAMLQCSDAFKRVLPPDLSPLPAFMSSGIRRPDGTPALAK